MYREGSRRLFNRRLYLEARVYLEGMESLSFRPGRAFLSVNSPAVPWTVVFEDEGLAGYFYACDRSQQTQEHSILDAMLVYNVGALKNPEDERLAAVEWSRDGMQAVLYLDGTAQALFDFRSRQGFLPHELPELRRRAGRPLEQSRSRLERSRYRALRGRALRLNQLDA